MLKNSTNEVIMVKNGTSSIVDACYAKKTERLSNLGFSITENGKLAFPDCFNIKITSGNVTEVLDDCIRLYTKVTNVLYYTDGGFDTEMVGWFLFELCKVLREECIIENAEWLQGYIKKCVDVTLFTAYSEAKGCFNKKYFYKIHFFNLLNELLTRYDFRDALNYFGDGGVVKSCRMSLGQVYITRALWRLSNDFCDISEVVNECFKIMKLLRLYTYDTNYKEYRDAFQKLEMTACYREISECIEFSRFWISNS